MTTAEQTPVVRYRMDAARSRFTVQAFSGGLLSAFAHSPTFAIRDFSGDIAFNPTNFAASRMSLQIPAESLALTDKVSDKDRQEIEQTMREQVLETARFPEIAFASNAVSGRKLYASQFRAEITGTLSLRGITRNLVIDAQLSVDRNSLRARGEFTLRQSDFQIKPVKAAGGTIKLKDELKFTFDIVATQETG